MWRKAIMENSITEWRHITNFDGKYTEMMQSYCLQTIPYTYILDEDNLIVDKGLSGDVSFLCGSGTDRADRHCDHRIGCKSYPERIAHAAGGTDHSEQRRG